MADNQIEIEIVLDDGQVRKGFGRITKSADKAGVSIGKRLSSAFTRLLPIIATVGTAIAAAFAGRKIIAAARQQEDAINQLNTSLRTAGVFTEEASQRFQDLASSIQRTSVIGDEAILQVAALARNFTRTNDEAERLTRAAVDLSEATNLTLESAVLNLGRTLSGLTGELGEAVPQVRVLTQEQLRAGEAINVIAERFGGAAQNQVNTFSGRIAQLNNLFGDLLEQIGFIVTRSPALVALFGELSVQISRVTGNVRELGESGDVFGRLLQSGLAFGLAFTEFVVAPVELAVNLVQLAFNSLTVAFQAQVAAIANAASAVVNLFSPESELAQGLNTFRDSANETFLSFAEGTRRSLDSVFNFETTDAIFRFTENLKFAVDSALSDTSRLSTEGGNNIKTFADNVNKQSKKAEFDLKTRIGGGISSAIQTTVSALISGENAFAAFSKAVLSVFGDLAIQLGQFFIINGIAIEALKALGGAAAVAAGIALVALGTILKAAGGGAPGLSGAGGQGGGVASPVGPGPGGGPNDTFIDQEQEDELERQRLTQVAVNVEGNVFDSDETGMRIVEIINDSFDSEGTRVQAGFA